MADLQDPSHGFHQLGVTEVLDLPTLANQNVRMNSGGNEPRTRRDWIDQRRKALRMTWEELALLADRSREGLRLIMNGSSTPTAKTVRRIEAALQWEAGSWEAIGNGESPTPTKVVDVRTASPDELADTFADMAELRELIELAAEIVNKQLGQLLPSNGWTCAKTWPRVGRMEVQMQTREVDPKQLRGMRELAGLSQAAAAKDAGLTPAWLNKVEQGTRRAGVTSLSALIAVYANRLDWPVEEVYLRVTTPAGKSRAA